VKKKLDEDSYQCFQRHYKLAKLLFNNSEYFIHHRLEISRGIPSFLTIVSLSLKETSVWKKKPTKKRKGSSAYHYNREKKLQVILKRQTRLL